MTVRMGGDAKAVGGSGRPLSPAVAARVAVKTTVPDGAVPRHLRASMPQRTADGHATHHFSSCSGGKRNPPCGKCAASASPCNRAGAEHRVQHDYHGFRTVVAQNRRHAFLSACRWTSSPLSVGVIAARRQRGSKHSVHNANSYRHSPGTGQLYPPFLLRTRHGAVHR